MRRIAIPLFFALGILSFVGCDVVRQIPVQYDTPTVVSMESVFVVSATQWNYGVITMSFDLPGGVLISPGDVVINGKPHYAEWKYYHQDAKMTRKVNQATEPFTTFSSESSEGERIRNIFLFKYSVIGR